jgi:hypothetical protein
VDTVTTGRRCPNVEHRGWSLGASASARRLPVDVFVALPSAGPRYILLFFGGERERAMGETGLNLAPITDDVALVGE